MTRKRKRLALILSALIGALTWMPRGTASGRCLNVHVRSPTMEGASTAALIAVAIFRSAA